MGLKPNGRLKRCIGDRSHAASRPLRVAWAVRLACDHKRASAAVESQLVKLAQTDDSLQVRCQLACSARRLPAQPCLAITRQLLARAEDVDDPQQPLLLWWAIEDKADSSQVLQLFADVDVWDFPLVKRHLITRVMRRYAQEGTREALSRCVSLFKASPSAEHSRLLLDGFEQAYQGRSLQGIPLALSKAIIAAGGGSLELRVRQGDPAAMQQALSQIRDEQIAAGQRVQLLGVLGELRYQPARAALLDRVVNDQSDEVRIAALAALQSFDADEISASILSVYNRLPDAVRPAALATLASRAAWASQLVAAVEANQIPANAIPAATVGNLWLHRDDDLQRRLHQIWGDIPGATTDEMRTQIDRLMRVIQTGSGVPNHGKPLFIEHCGKCHRLFEDGGEVGPNLTSTRSIRLATDHREHRKSEPCIARGIRESCHRDLGRTNHQRIVDRPRQPSRRHQESSRPDSSDPKIRSRRLGQIHSFVDARRYARDVDRSTGARLACVPAILAAATVNSSVRGQ